MQATDKGWVSSERPEEDHWFLGTLATVKASTAGTGGVLSAVEFLHPRHYATPRHVHHVADEAFYILSGSVHGFCGDRTWAAATGDFVWLPKGVPHGYSVADGDLVRTLALVMPAGFDTFVARAGEPALRHELPEGLVMPDLAVLLSAAADNEMEILGPPPDPEDDVPTTRPTASGGGRSSTPKA
jgi:quercetin dioxygenase-like cupin family protein